MRRTALHRLQSVSRTQLIIAALSSLITGALVTSVVAFAAGIPDGNGVIHGCYESKTGQLRVVSDSSDCKRKELSIQWNQVGPQGAQGIPGPQGPAGKGLQSIEDLNGTSCNSGAGKVSVSFDPSGIATVTCTGPTLMISGNKPVSGIGASFLVGIQIVRGSAAHQVNCPSLQCSTPVLFGSRIDFFAFNDSTYWLNIVGGCSGVVPPGANGQVCSMNMPSANALESVSFLTAPPPH